MTFDEWFYQSVACSKTGPICRDSIFNKAVDDRDYEALKSIVKQAFEYRQNA